MNDRKAIFAKLGTIFGSFGVACCGLSFIVFPFVFVSISFPLCILGMIFGIIGKGSQTMSKQGTSAMIIGIIGIVLSIVSVIVNSAFYRG